MLIFGGNGGLLGRRVLLREDRVDGKARAVRSGCGVDRWAVVAIFVEKSLDEGSLGEINMCVSCGSR